MRVTVVLKAAHSSRFALQDLKTRDNLLFKIFLIKSNFVSASYVRSFCCFAEDGKEMYQG